MCCNCDNCKYKKDYETKKEIATQWNKKKREERKLKGLCLYCGKHPALEGKTLCKECNENQKLRQKKQYANKKLAK